MDLNTKGFIKKKVSFALKMIVLVICFIIYMFPFVMVVINSFKTKRDIIKEPLSLIGTNGASVANYVEAFTKMNFPRTFMNSLCVTGISVLLIIVVSSMCAYIFVRTDYKLNKIFFSLMIASMVIPFQVIMIPLVSIYGGQLHLLNHRMTLILMHVGFSTAMSVFMYHGFIKSSIPLSLEEAARLDGCSRHQTFSGLCSLCLSRQRQRWLSCMPWGFGTISFSLPWFLPKRNCIRFPSQHRCSTEPIHRIWD